MPKPNPFVLGFQSFKDIQAKSIARKQTETEVRPLPCVVAGKRPLLPAGRGEEKKEKKIKNQTWKRKRRVNRENESEERVLENTKRRKKERERKRKKAKKKFQGFDISLSAEATYLCQVNLKRSIEC